MAEASYPEDLKYHAEHDWARIDGDQATFGVTWYAQDALGEVVFFDPPEVGTQVTRDQAYAEVEPAQRLVPFAFTGPGIPRQGNPVEAPHGAGVVTSGTLSPCLEIGIGMAYVPVADAEPGTALEVDVRGKARQAEVWQKPLYRREESG